MKHLLNLIILLPLLAASQIIKEHVKEDDPYKMEINKNIFRILLSLSTDTKFSVTGNYECEIKKPLTLFFKAGPAFDMLYDSTDAFNNKQYTWLFGVIASGEIRYYFNLRHRTKQQKTVKNFSAGYISFEELLQSKPLIILNKPVGENRSGSNKQFINIGYQKQFKRTYYSIFFGTRLPGKVYSNISSGINLLHCGIALGRTF